MSGSDLQSYNSVKKTQIGQSSATFSRKWQENHFWATFIWHNYTKLHTQIEKMQMNLDIYLKESEVKKWADLSI